MRSANGIRYEDLLALFEAGENIDETAFYFADDPTKDDHYLGYLPYPNLWHPEYTDKPYWAGYCDIEDGFECATAKELFEAPIYNGKSLKEQWNKAYIFQIGGVWAEEYVKMFADKFS